jgi:hypothetical protein
MVVPFSPLTIAKDNFRSTNCGCESRSPTTKERLLLGYSITALVYSRFLGATMERGMVLWSLEGPEPCFGQGVEKVGDGLASVTSLVLLALSEAKNHKTDAL